MKNMAEMYSRKTALSITTSVVHSVSNLLRSDLDLDFLNVTPAVTKLLPHIFASVSNLAKDPQSAVQILGLVQEILPHVSTLNNIQMDEEQHNEVSTQCLINNAICIYSIYNFLTTNETYEIKAV